MPDIDVEICPPGTMALLESLEWEWDGRWCHICENHQDAGHLADCKLSAILTAHRAQLDPGPTIKQSLTVQSTCKPSLQVDYTSETEDLSTWPQTRGSEWRRMADGEIIQKGDACASERFYFAGLVGQCADGFDAWTRRPAPESQPLRKEIGLCKWRLIG